MQSVAQPAEHRPIGQVTDSDYHCRQDCENRQQEQRHPKIVDRKLRDRNSQQREVRQLEIEILEDLLKLGHDFDHDERHDDGEREQHSRQVAESVEIGTPNGREVAPIAVAELLEGGRLGADGFPGGDVGHGFARQCLGTSPDRLGERHATTDQVEQLGTGPADRVVRRQTGDQRRRIELLAPFDHQGEQRTHRAATSGAALDHGLDQGHCGQERDNDPQDTQAHST